MQKYIKNIIGRIGLFEIVVIFLVVVGGWWYFNRKVVKSSDIYVEITDPMNVYTNKPEVANHWDVDGYNKGDAVSTSFGSYLGKIDEIEQYLWTSGQKVLTRMRLKIKAAYDPVRKVYVLDGGGVLSVGEVIQLRINNSTYKGLVRNIYLDPVASQGRFRKSRVVVKVRLNGYYNDHLEKLKKMEVVTLQGIKVAKVTDLVIEPAVEYAGGNLGGKVVLGNNPKKSDALITVELYNVECSREGTCVFIGGWIPISVGGELWLDSGQEFFGFNSQVVERKVYEQ